MGTLAFGPIGMLKFAEDFKGTIISETMLVDGVEYGREFEKIADCLVSLKRLGKAYVAPFLINGSNKVVRVDAVCHVAEAGFMNRAVYTTLNYTTTPKECAALKELGVRTAGIQAFNSRNPWIKWMYQLLMGTKGEGRLLHTASKSGIEPQASDPRARLGHAEYRPCSRRHPCVQEQVWLTRRSCAHWRSEFLEGYRRIRKYSD